MLVCVTCVLVCVTCDAAVVPDKESDTKKQVVVDLVAAIFAVSIPGSELHLYGSSASGCGFKSSDLDMCLIIPGTHYPYHVLDYAKLSFFLYYS